MTVKLHSFLLQGVTAVPIEVEVDLLQRLPCVVIVGLPGHTVRESADRVRSAITHSGFEFPKKRVVINLAPADLPKTGTSLDLAMAVGILLASGQLPPDYNGIPWDRICFHGELGLNGEVLPARGVSAGGAMVALQEGYYLMTGPGPAAAAKAMGAKVLRLDTLFNIDRPPMQMTIPEAEWEPHGSALLLSDVRGHSPELLEQLGKACAERKTVVLRGPPGCGKTMIAARLSQLLGPLPQVERLEVMQIHEAAGTLVYMDAAKVRRPFRAPHHTISAAGMVGSHNLRPGEMTLAHRGVLFLDELPEFSRHVIELVRSAHSLKEAVVTRAAGTVRLPADSWLVASVNPCPCGLNGTVNSPCTCSTEAVARYAARWQSMLPDAVVIDVPMLSAEQITGGAPWPDLVSPPF